MAAILPGYDLYTVLTGSTSINLEEIFPGAGTVYTNGVPVDPESLGETSTAIERKGTLPDGQSGVIPIEMILEHSVSVDPVDPTPFGVTGVEKADYHTIINSGGRFAGLPNTDGRVQPSLGSMAITRRSNVDGGGTYETQLNVNPLIVITVVGGSVLDLDGPDILTVIDASGYLNPVGSLGGKWSESSTGARALSAAEFSAGEFFAATDAVSGEPITVDWTSRRSLGARAVQLSQ